MSGIPRTEQKIKDLADESPVSWAVEMGKFAAKLERENAELKAHLKQLHQISKEEYTCRVVCLRNSIDNYMEKVKL